MAPNPLPASRDGDIVVNDDHLTVSQQAAPCQFDLQPASLTVPAAGGTTPLAVSTDGACSWRLTADVGWITFASPETGSGAGTVALRVAPNSGLDARVGTIAVGDVQVAVTQNGAMPDPTCVYSITVTTVFPLPASGGVGTVAVSTTPACAWTAVGTAPWIAVTAGAAGRGQGVVTFSVAGNPGGARAATLAVAGHAVAVTQDAAIPCTYTISPRSASIPETGGTRTVTVTAAAGCTWTADANDAWITVVSGARGSGDGAVTFSVAANAGGARTGTIAIAAQTFTVSQAAAPPPCAYAIAPKTASIPETGGTQTVMVTAGVGCTWTADANDAWITVVSGANGSGDGTVTFAVAANAGSARTGSLTIAGQTFTVSQAAAPVPCSYSIAPTTASMPDTGGTQTVMVTAGVGCTWTADANDAWITVVSGANGSGDGTVTFGVAANTGGARTGSLTIAGQTFTVNQAALVCAYTVSPTAFTFSDAGGSGSVTVSASAGCAWTAQPAEAWITITSGGTGTGDGTVDFSVDSHSAKKDRTGTMTIAGQTVTVLQRGKP